MLNATKACIMITTLFSMSQGKNHYTVSSANAYLKNLSKFHKIEIKRRWFFCCVRWLVDEGYIRRKERYLRDPNGLITQIPSMITFTLRGVVWLVSKGVTGAKKMYKNMMKFLKKQDNRFPLQQDFDDGSYKPADPDERRRLDGLLGIVAKEIE